MAALIVYPNTGYNSYGSVDDAEFFFESRLHSEAFLTSAYEVQSAALQTSFQSLAELSLSIRFNDDQTLSDSYTDSEKAKLLGLLSAAQCEQALHEIQTDLDGLQAISLNLSGLAIKIPDQKPQRYSQRALAILRPYRIAPTISRVR
jgi:hypothetical protein